MSLVMRITHLFTGSYRTNNTIESALFAEVSYDITDSLKGTIGIRRGDI
jgi:hypothetical protein